MIKTGRMIEREKEIQRILEREMDRMLESEKKRWKECTEKRRKIESMCQKEIKRDGENVRKMERMLES